MRQARILDVLCAVREVAPAHPEVEAWWYAPPRRLRLQGERPRDARGDACGGGSGSEGAPAIEVVVEAGSAASPDCVGIAAELARWLPGSALSVRLHRAAAEERQLFRLVSGRSRCGWYAAGGTPPDLANKAG
jgi:hypothetical protein